jgi:arginyl-tRNA synthetase
VRLERQLDALVNAAIRSALGLDAPALVRPANPAHGDFQVNAALPLAKQLGRPPRSLAEPLAQQLRAASEIERAEVAGPGFINLTLAPAFVAQAVLAAVNDVERDGVPPADRLLRTVVDFSGPNIAKQMHVGHLRSTIIGDALCRILRFAGHVVIGDNHIGDWGTQFGLLIVGMREFGSEEALERDPIDELERVYRLASAKAKTDEAFASAARAELAKLQRGDPANRAQWEHFVGVTKRELDRVYERFGIHFDEWLGESAYESMLPGVIDLLKQRGIAREDQGALCVFFPENAELGKSPFIVQKNDGAYLYSTTDIATVLYRRDHFQAERVVYVTDTRQTLHFKQLFAVARLLGVDVQLEHITFGSVLGKDGKPLKTRAGDVIALAALLDEAEERALERLQKAREENVIALDDAAIAALAPIVGIGAVKYADLMQNRASDYQFDWDKMISFKGNAGPYLQYAHARIAAIFRRGNVDPASLPRAAAIDLQHPAELGLAKALLHFGDVVHQAADQSLPHLLCEHLYNLARAFSVFYEACPVLKAEEPARRVRLLLAWLTARQLKRGLGLLGIAAPERM